MDHDEAKKVAGSLPRQASHLGPYDALSAARNPHGGQRDDPVGAFDPEGANSNPNVDPRVQASSGEGKEGTGLGRSAIVDGSHASAQAIREQDKYYEGDQASLAQRFKFHKG